MEPLLDHLAVMHKAPSMPHDRAERVDIDLIDPAPARALTGQICQRGAVPIIGLEPARPKLSRAALVSDGANSRTAPG
jgi:hypothetical protein